MQTCWAENIPHMTPLTEAHFQQKCVNFLTSVQSVHGKDINLNVLNGFICFQHREQPSRFYHLHKTENSFGLFDNNYHNPLGPSECVFLTDTKNTTFPRQWRNENFVVQGVKKSSNTPLSFVQFVSSFHTQDRVLPDGCFKANYINFQAGLKELILIPDEKNEVNVYSKKGSYPQLQTLYHTESSFLHALHQAYMQLLLEDYEHLIIFILSYKDVCDHCSLILLKQAICTLFNIQECDWHKVSIVCACWSKPKSDSHYWGREEDHEGLQVKIHCIE